jgi:hypothetical protein
MIATTKLPAVYDALKAALDAREYIQENGIVVTTAPAPDTSTAYTCIELGGAFINFEWAALGRKSRKETNTANGWIFCQEYGAGEAAAKAARDKVFAVFAELETALTEDPSISGVVNVARVKNAYFDQAIVGQTGNARGAALYFELEIFDSLRNT